MIQVPFLLILTYDKLPNSIIREIVYGCLYYPILAHNQRITRSTQTRFSWQTTQIRRHFDFDGSTFPSLSLPSIRSSKTGTAAYNVATFTDTGHECLFRLCLQRDLRTAFSVLPNSHGYAQKPEDIKYLRFNTFNRNAYVSESGWYSAGWQIGQTPLPLEYLLFVFRFHSREFPWKERHSVFPDFPWNNTVETGEILREEWKTRCGSTCIFDGSG